MNVVINSTERNSFLNGWALITASMIPANDEEENSLDLMPLSDIVITGIETPYNSFVIYNYDPDADGTDDNPWAELAPISTADGHNARLTQTTVRQAVSAYISKRLIKDGWTPAQIMESLQGHYMDAPIADAILQFAVYDEDILG